MNKPLIFFTNLMVNVLLYVIVGCSFDRLFDDFIPLVFELCIETFHSVAVEKMKCILWRDSKVSA